MRLFDTVRIDVLFATVQAKQLGEGLLIYLLTKGM
jgi:hypothetical protein